MKKMWRVEFKLHTACKYWYRSNNPGIHQNFDGRLAALAAVKKFGTPCVTGQYRLICSDGTIEEFPVGKVELEVNPPEPKSIKLPASTLLEFKRPSTPVFDITFEFLRASLTGYNKRRWEDRYQESPSDEGVSCSLVIHHEGRFLTGKGFAIHDPKDEWDYRCRIAALRAINTLLHESPKGSEEAEPTTAYRDWTKEEMQIEQAALLALSSVLEDTKLINQDKFNRTIWLGR